MAESELDIINGSDILVHVNVGTEELPEWKPVAHQTSCSVSNSSTTKERTTKASGLWKGKKVTGLATSIKCDALASYDADGGYAKMHELWIAAKELLIRYALVDTAGKDYYEGKFVITALERNDPAQDDSTMSVTFENSGAITPKTSPAA
jgi:predicted secreted protein